MINSITLEPHRLEGILLLVAEHKTKVIGLFQAASQPHLSGRSSHAVAGFRHHRSHR